MISIDTWIKGARPRTLPAAIAPVLVATALAKSHANIGRAALALLVSLALQIAVNYSNDYSDGVRGTDADRVGPVRLVGSGLASAAAVKRAALYSFTVAGLAGLALAWLSSWWLLAVGASAIFAAWTYTGGKNPYGYKGLGEISVFLFFGVVATVGSYFVQTEKITMKSFIVSIPMGALSCAILAVNNIRDLKKDAAVGKRTLAVRLGEKGSRRFFFALLLSAHIAALLTLSPWSLITLVLLPITFGLGRSVTSGIEARALIPVLAKTGQLQLLFSGLLATSLWLSK